MAATSKIVVFKLNKQLFGIDIQQVRMIERIPEITKVPKIPEYLRGVTVLHGEIIPIMDLKDRLHIGKTNYTDSTRIIIASINELQIGLLVDEATDVMDMDPKLITSPSTISENINDRFIKGIAKLESDLLILINLEEILNFNETDNIQEIIAMQ